jgi:hypothetical protein
MLAPAVLWGMVLSVVVAWLFSSQTLKNWIQMYLQRKATNRHRPNQHFEKDCQTMVSFLVAAMASSLPAVLGLEALPAVLDSTL